MVKPTRDLTPWNQAIAQAGKMSGKKMDLQNPEFMALARKIYSRMKPSLSRSIESKRSKMLRKSKRSAKRSANRSARK